MSWAQHLLGIEIVGNLRRGFLHRVLGGRAELEDPEIHLRDYLVAHAPGVAGGEEPALTQAGVLRAGDVGEFAAERDLLAHPGVAVVDGVAVGGHHRRVAGGVEQFGHPAERVLGARVPCRPRIVHTCDIAGGATIPG